MLTVTLGVTWTQFILAYIFHTQNKTNMLVIYFLWQFLLIALRSHLSIASFVGMWCMSCWVIVLYTIFFFFFITHLLKWCTGSTNITTITMCSGADPTPVNRWAIIAEKIKTSTACNLYDSLLSWFQNFDASLLLTATLQTSPLYDLLLLLYVCVCF